ncbi:MAG: flagellar biosynthesis protein FlhA [Calditrichaeota bacterium]|mgnify:CR=1 FL=1|nr:flagellar biosynthesis protein FlhA [Calditrichota bacterium]
MPDPKDKTQLFDISKNSSILLAGVIVMILGVMILPLPSFLMDMLLVMNITGALVILFVALYILRPLDFSVFPGLLLIITLFRLSLNVATTRLILGQGYAGEIIEAFGTFVVQGNYIVGAVIFLILVIINFVVITKGTTRIAEVSARFTLDAMPGKQMAIDADLNAGLIDDREAQERRETIAREADFYGSMDGSAKFVRGDAIAGLLITTINIIGGLAIGTLQRGLPIGEAASIYSLLTIGDGLVAQIPGLIISTAAAIIITRSTSEFDLGTNISDQLTSKPKAVFVTSTVLGFMAFLPGLPFFPFALMSVILASSGFLVLKSKSLQLERIAEEEALPPVEVEERIEEFLHPDPFEIEIGYGLIPLVDANQGGNLLGRISTIRKSIAVELGVIVPPIRIRDNIQLKSNGYVFKIYGINVIRGEVMMDYFLVLNPDDRIPLEGIETIEPTFGLPAIWISEREKEKAEIAGYTVVEPPAVIATHLIEVLKANVYKLLDRQETKRMLDHLKETHSAVTEGLVPEGIPLGVVTQILRNLLREKLPIRNLVSILETIADYAPFTKDPNILTEYVRTALSETITDYFKQGQDEITVATFEPQLEDAIMTAVKNGNGQSRNLGFEPIQVNKLFESIGEKVEKLISGGSRPVILVSSQIRRQVQSFMEPVLPDISILAYSELSSEVNLKSVGAVRYPNET